MGRQRVLVAYFSQSGQLREVLSQVTKSLAEDPSVELHWHEITPATPFPFPWSGEAFFGVFPESVKEVPCELAGEKVGQGYDLVVLGYQPWFLSPSIPATSFVKSAQGQAALQGAPVVTVLACRNMWISAQERMKALLASAGGHLVGNVVLDDRSANLTSLVTIFYWMLTGKRDRFLGVFPSPGVAREDVEAAQRFGPVLLDALKRGDFEGLQDALLAQGAVPVRAHLMNLETRARKLFELWADFVSAAEGAARKRRLKLFRTYLLTGVVVLSPASWLLTQLAAPLRKGANEARLRKVQAVA